MREIIEKELKEIEQKENVRIIYCVESGSRAWDFASPDSDYDVRFIYVREPSFYQRLEKTRDVIEWKLDDVLDINGWDLQKTLRLLHGSNPTIFEWYNSPIVYKTTEQWDKLAAVAMNYFSVRANVYHYLAMAKKNFKEYLLSDEVKLKKYFYVLRPLYASLWVLSHRTPPPSSFVLLHKEFADPTVKPFIDELFERKIYSPEIGTGRRIDEINRYVERTITEIENALKTVEERGEIGWSELNRLFLEII